MTRSVVLVAIFLNGCGTYLRDARNSEEWNPDNRPELFGARVLHEGEILAPEAMTGSLTEQPWSDSYWPLYQRGMAYRWNDLSVQFKTFEDQKKAAEAAVENGVAATFRLSPAEKYDLLTGKFHMTREGWQVWKKYEKYEGNWSWMGHCHGWAVAAYREKPPVHSAIIKKDGREVLFTEGDIRGLITKAYASNRMSEQTKFMGTRCNSQTIIRDEKGRIVDGTLHEGDKEKTIFIKRNFWQTHKVLTYAESKESADEKVLQVFAVAENPKGAFKVRLFETVEDYRRGQYKEGVFTYNRSCRDTNAASFHFTLVEYLSDMSQDKRGFVMDVTREHEVWNQPVYGFNSTIEMTGFDPEIDEFSEFRAGGTAKLAKVRTEVQYAVENGPFVTHPAETEKLESKVFSYTLEITGDGQIVGGEWDRYSSAPDFVWASQGTLLNSTIVNFDLIKRIHACSRGVENLRELKVEDVTIKANYCEI